MASAVFFLDLKGKVRPEHQLCSSQEKATRDANALGRPFLPATTVATSPCQPSRSSPSCSTKPKRRALPSRLVSRQKASTLVLPRLRLHARNSVTDSCDAPQYLYIRHNNLYLLALTKRNTNAAEILLFLHKIVEVFTEYFKELEEESIRDNFVVIYELLDEMMDFGYPQTTESKILQEHVARRSFLNTPLTKWRNVQVHHARVAQARSPSPPSYCCHQCCLVA